MRNRMTWSRMTLAAASIVALVIAASSFIVQPTRAQSTAQAKADECLSRPGATTPKGSHWFYRIERPSNRRCWYLGPANQRVVRQAVPAERAARAERAVPTPAPAPAELRADEQTRADTPPAVTTETNVTAAARNSVAATNFSAAWPAVAGANEVAAVAGNETTEDVAAAEAEAQPADLATVRPVVTAADRAAAQPSEPGVGHLVIFLSATAAFVAIAFRAVLKIAASQRGKSDRIPMPRPAGPVIRPRAPERPAPEPSIEAMSEPTIARLREIAKRWDTPARVARQPRLPAYEVEPDYQVEGPALRRQRVA